MNALAGQKAKANFPLFLACIELATDDGGRKDGGDFRRAVRG